MRTVKVQSIIEGTENPLVRGEEESLRRLFVNLVNNAVEAMDENGLLRIDFKQIDNFILTRITDSGKGIEEKDLKNLFSPFWTTKTRGTGLGLAIVKKIVDDHHGKIEIESKLGQGTTVMVYLPAW